MAAKAAPAQATRWRTSNRKNSHPRSRGLRVRGTSCSSHPAIGGTGRPGRALAEAACDNVSTQRLDQAAFEAVGEGLVPVDWAGRKHAATEPAQMQLPSNRSSFLTPTHLDTHRQALPDVMTRYVAAQMLRMQGMLGAGHHLPRLAGLESQHHRKPTPAVLLCRTMAALALLPALPRRRFAGKSHRCPKQNVKQELH